MPRAVPFGALILVLAATAAAAAPPCDPRKPGWCLSPDVDLSAVPDISQRIVADEPGGAAAKKPAFRPADAPAPYTGPTVEINRIPHPAPTIGYHWSLD